MRRALLVLAAAIAVASSCYAADTTIPPYIEAAVSYPMRRASDLVKDASHKPAGLFTFAGVKPGDRVAQLIPDDGYYARLLSKIITGSKGHVDVILPQELADWAGPFLASYTRSRFPRSAYPNVTLVVQPIEALSTSKPMDVVLVLGDYTILLAQEIGPPDVAAVNRAVFNLLKPGGLYIVSDHSAVPGSGFLDTERDAKKRLRRIDPVMVKKQVLAAGFVLQGESALLANPADPHTASPSDASIRWKTDQFLLKFRKPR